MDRCLKNKKAAIEEVNKLTKKLEQEKSSEVPDIDNVISLEEKLTYAKSAITAYTTEYIKLFDKNKDVTHSLKATRDQRKKRIEDSKNSWKGYLRALDAEQLRIKQGRDIELLKLAADKVANDLSQEYTYADGQIDIPLLNAETVDNELPEHGIEHPTKPVGVESE